MSQKQFLSRFKQLDAFPKINDDFSRKTLSGGVITLVASFFMIVLFISEFRQLLLVRVINELSVDSSRNEQTQVQVNITLPKIPCSWISIDVTDNSGEHHLDLEDHNIFKQRLFANGSLHEAQVKKHNIIKPHKQHGEVINGTYCGSCYGAEHDDVKCCNECEQVREAYRLKGWAFMDPQSIEQCRDEEYLAAIKEEDGEGCNVHGHLTLNKILGQFNLVPGKAYMLDDVVHHSLTPLQGKPIDFTHQIHQLQFGEKFPGQKNPLDGLTQETNSDRHNPFHMPMRTLYYLKIVPTSYTTITRSTIDSHQVSVTKHIDVVPQITERYLPGIFFHHDPSPIRVRYIEKRSSFVQFLTSVCALVGGIFSVSNLIDGFVYQGQRMIKQKQGMGKYI